MKKTQQRSETVSKLESLASHSNKFSRCTVNRPGLCDTYLVTMYAKYRFADAQEIKKYFQRRGIEFKHGPDAVNSDHFLPEDRLQPYYAFIEPAIYLTIGVPKNLKG
ncbi:MAG: hypothetical protein AABW48_04010 [Nanoarchaeota archaeon]